MVDKIIAKIKTEAEVEADKIIEDAEHEANRILEDGDATAKKERETFTKKVEVDIATLRNRILSEAKMAARRKILIAREEIIQECFDQAAEQLKGLSDKAYDEFMGTCIKAGAAAIEGDIIVGSPDGDTVKRVTSILGLKKNVELEIREEKGLGGIIVRSKDGKVAVDYTFEGLLDRMRAELRTEAAKLLFSEVSNA